MAALRAVELVFTVVPLVVTVDRVTIVGTMVEVATITTAVTMRREAVVQPTLVEILAATLTKTMRWLERSEGGSDPSQTDSG